MELSILEKIIRMLMLRKLSKLFSKALAVDNFELEFFEAGAEFDKRGELIKGNLVKIIKVHNMNVNTGLNFFRSAISRVTTPISYIGCGSGSTGVTSTDTTLETEIERVAVLAYDDTATGAVRFRAIFESNQGNGNLREFGLFTLSTGGTMPARTVLGASFTKDTSLVLRVNWTETFADS